MKSGIVLPKVAFSTLTAGSIGATSFFIGFDSDNSGILSKIDSLGNITPLEPTPTVVPYQEYKALLTQTSTGAPVESVLNDTLSVTGTWSYAGAGSYYFTSVGSFVDAGKVEVYIPGATVLGYPMSNAPFNIMSAARVSDDVVEVRTGQLYYASDAAGGVTLISDTLISSLLADNLLSNTPITIRVWS
jgi:hypothetical protein